MDLESVAATLPFTEVQWTFFYMLQLSNLARDILEGICWSSFSLIGYRSMLQVNVALPSALRGPFRVALHSRGFVTAGHGLIRWKPTWGDSQEATALKFNRNSMVTWGHAAGGDSSAVQGELKGVKCKPEDLHLLRFCRTAKCCRMGHKCNVQAWVCLKIVYP